jgi:hypothetical protein
VRGWRSVGRLVCRVSSWWWGVGGVCRERSMRLGVLLKTYPLVACENFLVNKIKLLALVYLLSRILL